MKKLSILGAAILTAYALAAFAFVTIGANLYEIDNVHFRE